MPFVINKPTCYDVLSEQEWGLGERVIRYGDLLIATQDSAEFNLTPGRVYVAQSHLGEGTYYDCVFLIDDLGKRTALSVENVMFYEGEPITQ